MTHMRGRKTLWRALSLGGAVMLAAIWATGCKSLSLGTKEPAEPPAEESVMLSMPKSEVPVAEVLDETPLVPHEIAPERAQGEEDESILPERKPAELSATGSGEYPDNLIKGVDDADAMVPVTLDLDAATVTEIVEAFAVLLGFDYLVDPGVKGSVTMNVQTEITARETWELFEHILWLAGAYASRNPGFIHIMPFSKMPHERRLLVDHDPIANVQVAFFPIRNTKSSEILGLLNPFLTEGATATDIPRLNTILLVEAPPNMPKLEELIKRLDTKGQADWPVKTLRCHRVDVDIVREELEAILPVLGLPVTGKESTGGEIKLVTIPRLQVLLASAALEDVLDEVERWVKVLDKEDLAEQEQIFFYNVKHSTAEHLNEILGVFFNASSTTASRPSQTRSTSARAADPTTGTTRTTPTNRTGTASRTTTSQQKKPEGEPETIFDTPVVVYADDQQNRLTIRTTQRAYAMVSALLERLDVPQRQVMIEAVIADIRLTEKTAYGFAYAAQHNERTKYNITNLLGAPTLADGARNMGSLDFANGTLQLIRGDKMEFLKAVADESNVKVISAPQIMAASDEEAKINIGTKVSIRTSEYGYGDTTTTTARGYYQYQETGTILSVTPHITAGNEVRLTISQEVSEVDPDTRDSESGAGPDIQNSNLDTTLIIPDGGTVMMGGLIKTKNTDAESGLPYLKDVPFLGALFRTNSTDVLRTELLVLITVRVIDRDSDVDLLAQRYQNALKEIREKLGP